MTQQEQLEILENDISEGQIELPDNYGMTSSFALAKWLWDRGWRLPNKRDDSKIQVLCNYCPSLNIVREYLISPWTVKAREGMKELANSHKHVQGLLVVELLVEMPKEFTKKFWDPSYLEDLRNACACKYWKK